MKQHQKQQLNSLEKRRGLAIIDLCLEIETLSEDRASAINGGNAPVPYGLVTYIKCFVAHDPDSALLPGCGL